MRKTIIPLLMLLTPLPVIADGQWGAKASFDINVPTKWKAGDTSIKMYDSGLGFSVGGVYTHYVTEGFFVEPSLSLFYDTYSTELSIMGEDETPAVDPRVYKVGLRLPLTAGYTFYLMEDFGLTVFTGPELNYAFAGGYSWKDKSIKDQIAPLFGCNDGQQRRLSCAWKGGIGVPISDWRIDFEAAVGLTDIIAGPASCKENRVSLSIVRHF